MLSGFNKKRQKVDYGMSNDFVQKDRFEKLEAQTDTVKKAYQD